MKIFPTFRNFGLLLAGLLGSLYSYAQLPIWYAASGKSIQFTNGSGTTPFSPTGSHPFNSSTTGYGAFGYYERPDGTPWFQMADANTLVSINSSGGQAGFAGVYPYIDDFYAVDAVNERHADVVTENGLHLIPLLGTCNQFMVIYNTYAHDGMDVNNDPLPVNRYLCRNLLTTSGTNGNTLSSLSYTPTYLKETQTATGDVRSTVSGPDAGNNFYLAAIGDFIGLFGSPGGATFSSGVSPFESKLIVYMITPSGVVTPIYNLPVSTSGISATNFVGATPVVSRDGTRVAWVARGTSGATDVVYINFNQPASNRVRYTSLYGSNAANLRGSSLAFNPANPNQIVVTGGNSAASGGYNGVTTLDYANAYVTTTAQPAASIVSTSYSYARYKLFNGYNGTMYAHLRSGSTSTTLRELQQNSNGTFYLSTQTNFSFGADIPRQIDGWNYNFSKAISGPTTASATATTPASVTFTGPGIRNVSGGQSATYSWTIVGSAGLLPGYPTAYGSSNTHTVSLPLSGSPYTVSVTTKLDYCGTVTYNGSPGKTLTLSDPNTPCCSRSIGNTATVPGVVALPNLTAETFTLVSAEEKEGSEMYAREGWAVRVLNSLGQPQTVLANYTSGTAISARGWKPGLYHVQVVRPGQKQPSHTKVMVIR